MEIILQKQKSITLSNVEIESVRDLFLEKKIIARVKGLDRPIILWNGEEEYNSASNWTNQTATDKAKQVLSLEEVPWAF